MLKMKKILVVFFSLFLFVGARAAQVANVEYVHNLISHVWGVDVPYNANLKSVKSVANMEYLLTAVDVANGLLNKGDKTDYRNSEYATRVAVDTVAVNGIVEKLIKPQTKHEFTLTTIPDTDSFQFVIGAAGEFTIDWGDGDVETIVKNNTTDITYSHEYLVPGVYKIGISGQATAYDNVSAAISFEYNSNIVSIDGSLGAVFGTLGNGWNRSSQPSFYASFADCKNLKTISETMFDGVYGQPRSNMFYATFDGCSELQAIPEDLFVGLEGALTEGLFYSTFRNCTSLKSIPYNLFGNLSGSLQYRTFVNMFRGCKNLSGISAKILSEDKMFLQFLYYRWTNGAPDTVGDMYYGCTGLQDYADIPTVWK